MNNKIFKKIDFPFSPQTSKSFNSEILNKNFKFNFNQKKDSKEEIPFLKGTTTLAFITKDGIIIAVDSRATSGSFIATQSINKVLEISPHLLGTMAGGAADCFFWEKLLSIRSKEYELDYNERISVKAAAMYLSDCIYRYKNRFSMGTMICGYEKNIYHKDGVISSDENKFVPSIYYVDDQGLLVRGSIFSVGSGSTVAYGALSDYDYNMDKNDALNMAKSAIMHAAHRDAYSGGNINLYFMDFNGWEKIGCWDIKDCIQLS
ncbi:Proteasome subunit beta type-5 [Dictyocoela muelleri]|nr:Proteasome subunit beta type-5 [Dictyocoela muelleri]